VAIAFTNDAPLEHNVTSPRAALSSGDTTFIRGSKTLSIKLAAASYTFYCSVPGHRQAGWKVRDVSLKLYVCWARSPRRVRGGHPCANAYNALKQAGHEPEVVKSYGWRRCRRCSTRPAGAERCRS